MFCECCAVQAKTKYVEFHRNIGAFVIRFSKSVKGHLCKTCINKYFWEFTVVNLTVGWLGIISLIVAPIYTIMNLFQYLSCLKLEPVPVNLRPPVLTPAVIRALEPFAQHMIQRLNSRESVENVANDLAPRCSVTPGQVVLYLRALSNASRR